MKSEPYRCGVCSMVFINSNELAKHQMVVHRKKMFQCQSCNKFFANEKDFGKHIMEVHSGNQQSSSSFVYRHHRSMEEEKEKSNEIESNLLKRVSEEEIAHKRTRRPYRKSSSSIASS
jgi:uncharacterized C2H2 Zn-finger protein